VVGVSINKKTIDEIVPNMTAFRTVRSRLFWAIMRFAIAHEDPLHCAAHKSR
jgi:hypothetical protein